MSSTDRQIDRYSTLKSCVNRSRVFHCVPRDWLLAGNSPGCYQGRRDDNTCTISYFERFQDGCVVEYLLLHILLLLLLYYIQHRAHSIQHKTRVVVICVWQLDRGCYADLSRVLRNVWLLRVGYSSVTLVWVVVRALLVGMNRTAVLNCCTLCTTAIYSVGDTKNLNLLELKKKKKKVVYLVLGNAGGNRGDVILPTTGFLPWHRQQQAQLHHQSSADTVIHGWSLFLFHAPQGQLARATHLKTEDHSENQSQKTGAPSRRCVAM